MAIKHKATIPRIDHSLEWRDVPGSDCQVSERGDIAYVVKTAEGWRKRIVRHPSKNQSGYYQTKLKLTIDGDYHNVAVHVVVAMAFLPPPPGPTGHGIGKYHLHHIDGDRTNNHCSNLEWVTPQENHALRDSTKKPYLGDYAQIEWNGETKSIGEWARQIGVTVETLRKRLRSDNWTVKRALTTPTRRYMARKYNALGESLPLSEWEKRTGIKAETIAGRINKQGWTVEKAVTEPVCPKTPRDFFWSNRR